MRYTKEHKTETRRRILNAAARLFRERGYEGAGVDAIMSEAGLTAGGFYAHFTSKEALFAEATTRFLPLGQGDVDFDDVIAAVIESGYDGWIVVELDSYEGDPREAAATSKKYLDALLATAGGTIPSGETR